MIIPQRFHIIFLIGVCLILFLPGFFTLPPTDRDESRFAQASKQMVESGNYIDIHFQNENRYKKPIGIYWLQSASVHMFGQDHHNPIWPYRIPSLIAGILAVVFTYLLGRDLFNNSEAGLFAAILLACCILLNVEARLAKTDAVLLACITIAQWAYYICIKLLSLEGEGDLQSKLGEGDNRLQLCRKLRSPSSGATRNLLPQGGRELFLQSYISNLTPHALLWLVVAAGILIKGPIVLLVVGLTILTLCVAHRDTRYFTATKPFLGFAILIACISPWLIAITQTSGNAFYKASLGHDFLSKVVSAQESHGAPPGFYLATFFVSFWPGSLLVPLIVPFIWYARRNPEITFLLSWIFPSWIVFEAMPTKLIHYTLPLFPAVALLVSAWITQSSLPHKIYRWLAFLPFAVIGIAFGVATFALQSQLLNNIDTQHHLFTAIVAVCFLVASAFLFAKSDWKRWSFINIIFMSLMYIGIIQIVLPSANALWPAREVKTILEQKNLNNHPIALFGYNEPSAVFLLGTKTQLFNDQVAPENFLKNTPDGVLIAAQKQKYGFYTEQKFSAPVIAEFSGFNYSKGGWLNFTIFAQEK